MRNFLITLLLFTASVGALAETLKLAVITSEIDKNVTEFYIETNDAGIIESLRYVTILPNGGIFEDQTVPADQVLREGTVIVERSGHDVVKLETEKFSLETGGTIKLNYLFNAMTGSRSVKRIQIKKQPEFHLYDLQNNKINRMFVKANTSRVFGIIGVRDIETSYQP